MNEVKIMEKLDHTNIIKIYEYKKVYNKFIIYMEYADDGTTSTFHYFRRPPQKGRRP